MAKAILELAKQNYYLRICQPRYKRLQIRYAKSENIFQLLHYTAAG